MKKIFALLCVSLFSLNGLAQALVGEPQTPVYPALEQEGSFSMIMVPDPQTYVKFSVNQPLFELQTAWIAHNIDRLNIKAALFTGDMVEQNSKLIKKGYPNAYNGDQTGRQQWEAVSRSLKRLDHRLPYIIAQGNHDIGYASAEIRYTLFPEYFYPDRNIAFEKTLVATCPNYKGVHTMENSAYEFEDKNWGKLLVITFEFAPRDEALDWARQLIESEAFQDHRVIVLVHSFMNNKAERYAKEGYMVTPCNWAEAVWQKLVYPSKNIGLVLCGHSGTSPDMKVEGEIDYSTTCSFRTDKAADGHTVHQMMFNSQQGDGSWHGNGGDGWLRILEFKPDGKTIGVRTFSPLFALSIRTQDMAWRTAPYDQFEFILE